MVECADEDVGFFDRSLIYIGFFAHIFYTHTHGDVIANFMCVCVCVCVCV